MCLFDFLMNAKEIYQIHVLVSYLVCLPLTFFKCSEKQQIVYIWKSAMVFVLLEKLFETQLAAFDGAEICIAGGLD